MAEVDLPDWVTYPEQQWRRISPSEAGLDAERFEQLVSESHVHGAAWEGETHEGDDWGAMVTRGGYLVHSWGDPDYSYQTASVAKAFTRALVGLAVWEGRIHEDDPICRTWTGERQLSHPHKYLIEGHHSKLTWRHLIGRANDTSKHYGGFPVTNGYFWRKRAYAHSRRGFVNGSFTGRPDAKDDPGEPVPPWATWTGDPLFDNYAHVEPGTEGVRAEEEEEE